MKRYGAPLVVLGASLLADVALRTGAYADRIEYLYYRAGVLKTAGVYVLALAATALVLAALYSIPRFGRWIVGLALGLSFFAHMAYHATVGHFVNAEDIRILESADPAAYRGAVTSQYRPELWIFVPIAIALALGAAWLGRRFPSPLRSPRSVLALFGVAIGANYLLWDYLYFKCNDFPVEVLSSTLRTAFYVEREDREFLGIERAALARASERPPEDNVVLIIDESVRSDYVSINRPDVATTPFLAELAKQPGFVNYGLMVSATTCSLATKALIFTGTTVAPDVDRLAMRNPTIFQHAKRWGYRTIVLDGPGRNFPNVAIRTRDLDPFDVLLRAGEIPGESGFADIDAAESIRKTVRESTGNFIVLIKVGAHFHYERCYPSAEARHSPFVPKLRLDESYGSSREKTINSYKNALRFTVDTFFETLMAEPLPNTTVLWTSDHGQSLQERGQTYTHCKDEIEQAVVPFAVITNVDWALASAYRPARAPLVLSHHHLYPSLISLFAKQRDVEHAGYRSIFSDRIAEELPPPRYVYGGIWASSHTITPDAQQLERFR